MATIGINGLDLVGKQGFAKAGVSRYCQELLSGLLPMLTEVHRVVVFLEPGHVVSEQWKTIPNCQFVHSAGRFALNKTLWGTLSSMAEIRKHKIDLWFS